MRNVSHERCERIILLQEAYEKMGFSGKSGKGFSASGSEAGYGRKEVGFSTDDMSFVLMDMDIFWTYFGESDDVFTVP